MPKFTATHGVRFADIKVGFDYDREVTGSSREKVYVADLSAADAKKLKALPADVLAEFGIVEVKGDATDSEGE